MARALKQKMKPEIRCLEREKEKKKKENREKQNEPKRS
jgi:hypothetical protein